MPETRPPAVETYRQWFQDNNCKRIRVDISKFKGEPDRVYEYYTVNGRLAILLYTEGYKDDRDRYCEILVPLTNSAAIVDDIDALNALRLGI